MDTETDKTTDNFVSYKKLVILLVAVGFLWLGYRAGLLELWLFDEEYGHGLMVIGLLGYLLYKNSEKLFNELKPQAWAGIIISVLALTIYIVGDVAKINQLRMYAIFLFFLSIILVIGGWVLLRKMIMPLFIIFLLIPLPGSFGPYLTAELQLISSKLGVWFIRLFGGIVYLEGNIIDMGGVKLLVAEACAGLRYLFPLMSIGAIAAFIMQAPLWMRIILFLSSIPITIVMNSLRIGITGILTDAYGSEHTEGFLHFFEGWVVFITSLAFMLAFAFIMVKFIPGKPNFISVFSFENLYGREAVKGDSHLQIKRTFSQYVVIVSIVVAVISSLPVFERDNNYVARKNFSVFPSAIGEWNAVESRLTPSIEAVASATDYFYGDFYSKTQDKINLYVAFYQDQKKGAAPHSPKVCIPGDGWQITSDTPVELKSTTGKSFNARRLEITKAENRIITYYWLKQGDNTYSEQMMARLNLVWFALTQNRADAALVRLVSAVEKDETNKQVDERLQRFASRLLDVLPAFVPD